MPQVCQQFWPCRAVPPEWLWMPIVMPLLAIVLVGVPVASILHRAGRKHLAPCRPQPLVDADRVHSPDKSDRPLALCLQPLACR
jgi:hypothetical protein